MRGLLAASVALCIASQLAAQSSTRDWRPEDRTVIGDFSQVTAIAASSDRVFIASPAALLIWNPQFQKWEGSFDPPDPTLLARVFTGVIDPLDNSVWLARSDGWIHYQPDLRLWDQGPVPQGIQAIAFDRDDPAAGLYLRSPQGWLLLPRGGLVASSASSPSRPILPPTIDQAIRSNPTLQANSAAILSDNRLRNVHYTAVARASDNRGWYLGTSGIGALYLSDVAALPERMSFGLPAPQVGAVFSWPGGVWAATNRNRLTDASLTFVGEQLDSFHSLPGPSAMGPPFNQVRELAGQGRSVWAATDLGVARVQPPDGKLELISDGRGLPDRRVYSIVSRSGRITVGTAHGLARISDSLRVERVAPSYSDAVYAVWPAGDSVWVGTPSGLLLSLPNQDGLVRPAGLESASLKGVVVDLAPLADTLVALTRDQLLWRDPRTNRWSLGPSLSALLGPLRRFVADGPGFWVAGDRGLGYARLGSPPIRPLREGDLPGAVNDIAIDDTFLWVATDGGLVRFRLDAVRP